MIEITDSLEKKILNKIRIIGTNHISKQSTKNIKEAFLEFKPTSICVELDSQRAKSLTNPQKQKINLRMIKILGFKGFIFFLITKFLQEKLGKIVNVKPGVDMLFAMNLAKNNYLNLFLIDQPIEKTIRFLGKEITFKEKIEFVKDLFKALFFPKRQKKIKLDITKVPSQTIIDELMNQLKKKYPSIYKVLIHDRNIFMAKKIVHLMKKNPEDRFLVVVGAGHEVGLIQSIKHFYNKIEVI